MNEILSEETKNVLRDTFRQLKGKVLIELFTGEEATRYTEATAAILKVFAELTDKIELRSYGLDSDAAKQRGVTRSPTILINPDKYKVSYVGAPMGEEARTLIMATMIASYNSTTLPDAALKRLFELNELRQIQVFVSPTCPYCPQQALSAISAAIAMPELVKTEIIEMYENRDFIEKYHIMTVPFTVINDVPMGTGVKPAELFVEEIIGLLPVEKTIIASGNGVVEVDIVIVGGGPAGLTAGMYAGRSGLKNILLEKANAGGQVLVTPVVENYPAFSHIAGKTLVDLMYRQTLQYSPIFEGEDVVDVKRADGIFELKTNRRTCKARGIIIATGAQHKKMDVPGEKVFYGKGVSYCAACDGYFYKDGKKVIVVGGGNTAATDALYLHGIGADVSLVHRNDRLRAEMFLQKSLTDKKIPVYRDSVVKEIVGVNTVEKVVLRNLQDNSEKEMPVDGVFIAIGYAPNNEIAKMLGLELDGEGYVRVDNRQRTSVPMVYAAGDVTGGTKQIATAVGQGAVAAISAFEDLSKPYWKKK